MKIQSKSKGESLLFLLFFCYRRSVSVRRVASRVLRYIALTVYKSTLFVTIHKPFPAISNIFTNLQAHVRYSIIIME